MKKPLPENFIRLVILGTFLLMPRLSVSQVAQLPLVRLTHEEKTQPDNAGSLSIVFTKSAVTPAATGNVAPTYGGLGQNAYDFGSTPGNYYVESSTVLDGLKNLSGFTLAGWLNTASLTTGSGGNRIISWINNGGDGVDLVLQNNGSLRLGVDGWPDASPAFSSANKVTASAVGASDNWIFFAVTYQSNGQVRFYFGNGTDNATLDVSRTYRGAGVTGSAIGKLAFGAFNDATRNSGTWNRMFRGVLDDLRIYGSALSTTDIVAVQRNTLGDAIAPTVPTNVRSSFVGPTRVGLAWDAGSDNVGVVGYDIYDHGYFLASVGPVTTYTLTGLTSNRTYNIAMRSKDAAGNFSAYSPNLVITTPVITPNEPLLYMPLNDVGGGAPVNVGIVQGPIFTTGTGPSNTFLPGSSLQTPPYVGGTASADFGVTPGNAFIESQAPIDQLKSLNAFTITGWLNCKSNVVGSGGNRVVSWINSGGDGVDLVYQSNGSLRLGVDGWPDNSPAFSNPNKVTSNSSAPRSNWVFFAVTYQSNGQVQFYFGTNLAKATLDATKTYAGPGVTGSNIGKFAIGAFNSATRNASTYDRMFRGLIDDIRVFGGVLSLADVIGVQGKNSTDVTSPTPPTNLMATSKSVSTIALSWTLPTDNVAIDGYELYNGENIVARIASTGTQVSTYTLTNLTAATNYNLTLKAYDTPGNLSPASNLISVTTDATGVPLPIIDAKFEESTGNMPNEGTADVVFVRSPFSSTPIVSTNVPTVPNDLRSADFGTISGDNFISSYLPVTELTNMSSFTLTGWINTRSNTAGAGGNRIISWTNNGGDGVDLVYQSDGSLRLGVDEFAGSSPAVSSASKVTTDPNAGAANWVFFAVTYQSNGQVKFYFGNNTTDATLDITKSYPGRGTVGNNIGKLAFGAFNDATRSAANYENMFRGIIDNFKVYGSGLSLTNIRAVQRGVSSDTTPPSAPTNLTASDNQGTSMMMSWAASTDNVAVVDYNIYNGTSLLETSRGPYNSIYVGGLTSGANYSFSVKARDAAGNLSASSNVLNIQSTLLPLIYVPFQVYTNASSHDNFGTLGGDFYGTAVSTNTPNGGAPFSYTTKIGGDVYDGLKNLSAFTITGWINKTSNASPQRIFGWMPDGGGDGVELLLQTDGRLRLGVDGLAESSPAFSNANKVTTNSSAPQSNWVFFAVTYQSNGQTQFYFGNDAVDATLDATVNYPNAGNTGSNISNLYIGSPSGSLIDELRVFGSAISLQQIVALQHGPEDNIAPTSPGTLSITNFLGTFVALSWTNVSTDNVGVTSYDVFNGSTLLKRHVPFPKLNDYTFTYVDNLTPGATYNLSVKARDSRGNYSPPTNVVQLTAQQQPLVWLKLDELTGVAPSNSGSAGSSYNRSFGSSFPWPIGSDNVPTGIASLKSADYGSVSANAFIESVAPINELKSLSAFTITGWVNNKSNVTGSGGNRIVSWINNGGDGVDLVYQSNGSLRLGVDAWPDVSPAVSSTNKVTTNASATAANWIFFTVTYTESGTVQFYFGDNTLNATLDVTKSYPGRGATGSNIGKLAIGNFNDASRSSMTIDRVFRGLIDDIRIYGTVLNSTQIQQIQRSAAVISSTARSIAATPEPIIKDEILDETLLSQNYPNPFDTETNIEVNIPHSVSVARLMVSDLMGRSLQNIDIDGRGPTSVSVSSRGMSSGVYIYTLMTDGKIVGYKRMMVK